MKTDLGLIELATKIERNAKARVDYIADTRNLKMTVGDAESGSADDRTRLIMSNGADTVIGLGSNAHRQIGDRLGIPKKYYDKMLVDQPELLVTNVNRWFQAEPDTRMIRTLDGKADAFLSNAYQRVDNHHVAEVALPVLLSTPGVEVVSSSVTESRLYIKAVTHSVRAEIKSLRRGDIVEAGVMISNSEVGLGAVSVIPFVNFLYCTNGMVLAKQGLRQAHIGTKLDGDESLAMILADDTRKAIDRSILLKVRDHLKAAMSQASLDKFVADVQQTTERQITGNPARTIEVLASDFGVTKEEGSSILRHLIQGGDTSQYGVINAVTRTAEDLESYDRATEFEMLGGRLVDLPANQWKRYAEAA